VSGLPSPSSFSDLDRLAVFTPPPFWSARGFCLLLTAALTFSPSLCERNADLSSVPSSLLSDGSGAYATAHYPNLFKEQGHSERAITRKINAAFQQLFHGDPQTQAVYFPAGRNANGPLAYLTDWAHHDVRTEGMSYGMMIAVQLNKKHEFDALWNWAKTYMYISDPHHPSYGYFSWFCKPDGTPNEETPAPDGEEYFVMSLYFAANRWGNGKGIYNYKAQADQLLSTMRHHPIVSGHERYYDGMLYLLNMLHVSGRFRIWKPQPGKCFSLSRGLGAHDISSQRVFKPCGIES